MAKVRNERERKVLLGVHKRDYHNGNLAEKPSKLDYETLNRAYEIPRFDNNYCSANAMIPNTTKLIIHIYFNLPSEGT